MKTGQNPLSHHAELTAADLHTCPTGWHRDCTTAEFIAEFAAIETTLVHACNELAGLLTIRGDLAKLYEAQRYGVAALRGLRGVADTLTVTTTPRFT